MLSYNELPEKCSHLNSALLAVWKIKEAMLMHILVKNLEFFIKNIQIFGSTEFRHPASGISL